MSKIIGIEIDNEQISMAQLSGAKSVLNVRRLPENYISGGHIVSPTLMAKLLKEMKKEAGFSGKDCVWVIPESLCFFRSFHLPVMSDAQLKLNLPYEFKDYVGANAINYTFDYAIREIQKDEEGKPVSMDIYAAAAERSVINEYAEVFKKGGLRLKAALPHDMVMINLLKNAGSENQGDEAVVLEMSYDDLHLFIIRGGQIAGDKIIDIGMKSVDAAIAEKYNIDPYLATTYREQNHENVLTSPECGAVYESMALEVMKTVNFYKYENPESELNQIAFCGVGSLDENLTRTVLDYIDFETWDMKHILPAGCREEENSRLCILSIGATL